jgi:hypothetical protein
MLWVKLDVRFFRGSDGDASVTLGVPTIFLDSVFPLSLGIPSGRIRTAVRPQYAYQKTCDSDERQGAEGISGASVPDNCCGVSMKLLRLAAHFTRSALKLRRGVAQGVACRVVHFASDFLNRSSCFLGIRCFFLLQDEGARRGRSRCSPQAMCWGRGKSGRPGHGIKLDNVTNNGRSNRDREHL